MIFGNTCVTIPGCAIFSAPVQTRRCVHPASCKIGTKFLSRGKAAEAWTLTFSPSIAKLNEQGYTSATSLGFHNLLQSNIYFYFFNRASACGDNAMYTNSGSARFESELEEQLFPWSFSSSRQKPDYCLRLANAILQTSCQFITHRSF